MMCNYSFSSWKYAVVLALTSLAFSSCYTYKIYPKEYRTYTYTGKREIAYVKNPELVKEFRIFQAANIFQLTNDSTDTAATQVKLLPMRRDYVCGQAILASAITLGQLPIYLPDRYYYYFDEIHSTETIHQHFELRVATRYWFWDMFAFKKNFKQKAGQALLANYHTKQLGCSNCQETSFIPTQPSGSQ